MPQPHPGLHRASGSLFVVTECVTHQLGGDVHNLDHAVVGHAGGVLRIDIDQSLDTGVQRVMRERLGIDMPFPEQLCAVGGPKRDPRAPWAISLVYRALVPIERVQASAGKRIEALEWRPVEQAMAEPLAFDHAELIERAVRATRLQIDRMEMPTGLLGNEFTLG